MKLIIAIAIALFLAIPSAMAETTYGCEDTIPALEGNVITLEMDPDEVFYDYVWTLDTGLTLEDTYTLNDRVIKVRVDELDACADYTVHAYMAVNTKLLTAPGDCIDECDIYVRACPVDCPPTDDLGTICETDWPDQESVGTDELWTLTIYPTYTGGVGSGTWTSGTKFTWTITETSDNPTWTPKVYGPTTDQNYVDIALGDFDPVTNDNPEKCFDVDVLVEDAEDNVLLDTSTTTGCSPIGQVCLVFDPTVTVTGSVA